MGRVWEAVFSAGRVGGGSEGIKTHLGLLLLLGVDRAKGKSCNCELAKHDRRALWVLSAPATCLIDVAELPISVLFAKALAKLERPFAVGRRAGVA